MVYLIHFKESYKGCNHYIGYCEEDNLESRFSRHKSGCGAKLLRALNIAGIDYEIVRTWPGKDKHFERKLKNQKNAHRFCPICNPENYRKKKE
jgi:predicted GIY-YIG superfamily endonuclease